VTRKEKHGPTVGRRKVRAGRRTGENYRDCISMGGEKRMVCFWSEKGSIKHILRHAVKRFYLGGEKVRGSHGRLRGSRTPSCRIAGPGEILVISSFRKEGPGRGRKKRRGCKFWEERGGSRIIIDCRRDSGRVPFFMEKKKQKGGEA